MEGRNTDAEKEKMNRSTIIFITILSAVAVLLGYNYFFQPFSRTEEPDSTQVNVIVEKVINSPDSNLSTEQKITQLIALPVTLTRDELASDSGSLDPSLEWIRDNQPGFVTIFGEKISTQSAQINIKLINQEYDSFGRYPLIAVDHEGGSVQRLSGDGFTKLPSWKSRCQAKNDDESASIDESKDSEEDSLYEQSARELRQVGVQLVFAPVLDVASDNPVLKTRVCGADPEVVTRVSSKFISTFLDEGILSVVKHFPGIGKITKNLHQSFDRVSLEVDDIVVYRDILEKHPNIGVMISHVGVEDEYDDLPCSLSIDCVGEISNTFPETIIFTDALEMASAGFIDDETEVKKPLKQRALDALRAGNVVLVFGPRVNLDELSEVVDFLAASYQSDDFIKKRVDENLRKVRELRGE